MFVIVADTEEMIQSDQKLSTQFLYIFYGRIVFSIITNMYVW